MVYGAPALVAAVGLRARARVESIESTPPGRVELRLPDLDHRESLTLGEVLSYARRARERWAEYRRSPDRRAFSEMRGQGAAHVTLVALGEATEAADPGGIDRATESSTRGEDALRSGEAGVRVEVRSEIPVGRGFGSSAAVGSAVAAAWLARHGVELPPGEMEGLVGEVERRQHGDPSGVDAAAVIRGGLVWAAETGEGEGRRFEPASVRPELLDGFRLLDTGPPAEETGEVVSAVRERRERDPEGIGRTLRRIRDATVEFRRLLEGGGPGRSDVAGLVRRCQRGLEELGVVPEPVRRLVRAVEAEGGAAKISGAGALTSRGDGHPGGGLLLVYHPEPGEVEEWPFLADLDLLDVRFGARGLALEGAP